MSKPLCALLMSLLLLGCAGTGGLSKADRDGGEPKDARVVLTVVNATIQPTKPTGEPWGPPARGDLVLLKLLVEGASLVFDVPSMGKFAQELMGVGDTNPRSPSPFVRISYRGRAYATNARARTTVPTWDYPMLLDLSSDEEPVTVSLFGAEIEKGQAGPVLRAEPIGTLHLAPQKLRAPGLWKLGPFGSVKELYVRVEPYTSAFQTSRRRVVVDGKQAWTSSGTRLVAGQRVMVSAAGRLCASRNTCAGPDGFPPPRWAKYSLVKDSPHAGLLMRVAEGTPRFVGSRADVYVGESGFLSFGANDRDLSNNTGTYELEFSVE